MANSEAEVAHGEVDAVAEVVEAEVARQIKCVAGFKGQMDAATSNALFTIHQALNSKQILEINQLTPNHSFPISLLDLANLELIAANS